MRIAGRITPADVLRLCDELDRILRDDGAGDGGTQGEADGCAGGSPPDEVFCDVGGLTQVNLSAVDALARLHLTARRRGSRLRLRNAEPGLLALLDLVGLPELADAAQQPPPLPARPCRSAAVTGEAAAFRRGGGG
ncbi:STAS domain-containing protein [Streptomyces sp. NPDC003023]|uniref:STAS domain-containing protein n=1 Tax=Streptomyces sp. NPDC003023 TaxID=3364675 RepID=UPI00368BF2EA